MTESHKPLGQCTVVEFVQLHPCSLHDVEVGDDQFADATVVGQDGLPPRLSHVTGRRLDSRGMQLTQPNAHGLYQSAGVRPLSWSARRTQEAPVHQHRAHSVTGEYDTGN